MHAGEVLIITCNLHSVIRKREAEAPERGQGTYGHSTGHLHLQLQVSLYMCPIYAPRSLLLTPPVP